MRALLWMMMLAGTGLVGCGGEEVGPDADTVADADFDEADVADADFDEADVADADFDEADVADADFDEADADGDRCGLAAVAAAISPAELRQTIAELTSFDERSSHASQQQASLMLQARLAELGVDHEVRPYDWNREEWDNIEVVLPGDELGGEIYAAGAHFDSTSNVPGDAPGADDNASGVAAVVEIARALSGCSYRRTIRLVLFSNEEAGMVGSAAYASQAREEGDDIRGFLNLDMIAFGPDDEDLDVATRPEYASLAQRVVDATERWVGLDTVTHIDDHCG